MFSRRLQMLLLMIAVSPLCGCSFSSQGLGTLSAHGPCKTLGFDLRPGQGAPGPDICLHDRCLGWVFGRNRGPFFHLVRGTTDPGCGNGNCRSLIGGTHTVVEQFPGVNGSPNPVVNQTAIGVRTPFAATGTPTLATRPTLVADPFSAHAQVARTAPRAATVPRGATATIADSPRSAWVSRQPTSPKPANRLAQQRFDPWR